MKITETQLGPLKINEQHCAQVWKIWRPKSRKRIPPGLPLETHTAAAVARTGARVVVLVTGPRRDDVERVSRRLVQRRVDKTDGRLAGGEAQPVDDCEHRRNDGRGYGCTPIDVRVLIRPTLATDHDIVIPAERH